MKLLSRLLLTWAFLFGATLTRAVIAADPPCHCHEKVCTCYREIKSNGWKALESKRFCVHYVGSSEVAKQLVPLCERTCEALRERWLTDEHKLDGTPKCDVFLYPSAQVFEKSTKVPAVAWGFADLAIGDGKVWMRRLNIRTDDEERLPRILVHELTHVVLAEHFAKKPIPRWADEGIAVISEPAERQRLQMEWLADEGDRKRLFSLKDLTRQTQVPQDQRQCDLFYAQSGALVDFLLTEKKLPEPKVLNFVEECELKGWEPTVKKWFPKSSTQQFEVAWRDWLKVRRDEFVASNTQADQIVKASAIID